MSSRAQAHIRLSALQHNLQRVKALAPNSRVMAAIKADAYGHGALQVASALADADALAVATLEEAMQLHWHGEKRPIVLLGGVQTLQALRTAAEHGFEVVIHDDSQLALLEELEPVWTLAVWIKLDTGMHRLGFAPERVEELQSVLKRLPLLQLCGWMTHLACADDVEHPLTEQQLSCFDRALANVEGQRSIANSAGIISWSQSHVDWVRPGIMLYGSSPLRGGRAADHDLQVVMSLRSCLIAVHEVAAGEGIGYGQTWVCAKDSRVGVVGIGYGDGYPRNVPNGTAVAIADQRLPIIGRVSMDMICIDLSDKADAKVGDVVELWGDDIPVDEIAEAADTISYELFCRLTGRVETIYS